MFRQCRLFLRKLKDTLKIPVLALVDSDPYGLKILSVFMKGRTPCSRLFPPCVESDAREVQES